MMRPGRPDEQVVDHPHGREVEGILVEHPDTMAIGVGRRADADGPPSRRMRAAVGGLEPREDLHQRALAGAVLAEDALDGARGHGQGDAVVRLDGAEVLPDVSELDFHRTVRLGQAEAERGDRSASPFAMQHVSSVMPPGLFGYALAFHAFEQLWQVPDLLIGGVLTVLEVGGCHPEG